VGRLRRINMLNFLNQWLILCVLFLAILSIIEMLRLFAGRELLIDKLIACLQVVYQRSAPLDSLDNKEVDWLVSELSFKGQVIKYSFEEPNRK
jgi:hypothetical protein